MATIKAMIAMASDNHGNHLLSFCILAASACSFMVSALSFSVSILMRSNSAILIALFSVYAFMICPLGDFATAVCLACEIYYRTICPNCQALFINLFWVLGGAVWRLFDRIFNCAYYARCDDFMMIYYARLIVVLCRIWRRLTSPR